MAHSLERGDGTGQTGEKVASNDTHSRRGRDRPYQWKRRAGVVRGAHLLDAGEGSGQGIRDTGHGRKSKQPSKSGCGKQARCKYPLHYRKKTRGDYPLATG